MIWYPGKKLGLHFRRRYIDATLSFHQGRLGLLCGGPATTALSSSGRSNAFTKGPLNGYTILSLFKSLTIMYLETPTQPHLNHLI